MGTPHGSSCEAVNDEQGGANFATPCVTLSSSRNAVSFSSASTMKRLPSSRWASAIQIVGVSSSCSFTFPQYKEKPGVEHGQDEDGYAHIVDDIVIENRSRFEVV